VNQPVVHVVEAASAPSFIGVNRGYRRILLNTTGLIDEVVALFDNATAQNVIAAADRRQGTSVLGGVQLEVVLGGTASE